MELIYILLYFLIYSFGGWVYESTICSIHKYGKIINRGFLIGPYCPIYGLGAIVNVLLLKDVESSLAIFIIALILTTTLEYATSFSMEKMFKARWWDYSSLPFNIKGRVCLFASVVFGMGSVVLFKVVHPLLTNSVATYDQQSVYSVTILLAGLFLLDLGITVAKEGQVDHKLRTHNGLVMRPGKKLHDLKLKYIR